LAKYRKLINVPSLSHGGGAWLVTWMSQVRGWAAAVCRLLADQPWPSWITGEFRVLHYG